MWRPAVFGFSWVPSSLSSPSFPAPRPLAVPAPGIPWFPHPISLGTPLCPQPHALMQCIAFLVRLIAAARAHYETIQPADRRALRRQRPLCALPAFHAPWPVAGGSMESDAAFFGLPPRNGAMLPPPVGWRRAFCVLQHSPRPLASPPRTAAPHAPTHPATRSRFPYTPSANPSPPDCAPPFSGRRPRCHTVPT